MLGRCMPKRRKPCLKTKPPKAFPCSGTWFTRKHPFLKEFSVRKTIKAELPEPGGESRWKPREAGAERPRRGDRRHIITPPIHAHGPTQLRHDASGTSANIWPRRISRGCLAFNRQRRNDDTIPFAIRPKKRAAPAALSNCDKRRQRICHNVKPFDMAHFSPLLPSSEGF